MPSRQLTLSPTDNAEYEQLRADWIKEHKVDISMAKMIRIFAECYKEKAEREEIK